MPTVTISNLIFYSCQYQFRRNMHFKRVNTAVLIQCEFQFINSSVHNSFVELAVLLTHATMYEANISHFSGFSLVTGEPEIYPYEFSTFVQNSPHYISWYSRLIQVFTVCALNEYYWIRFVYLLTQCVSLSALKVKSKHTNSTTTKEEMLIKTRYICIWIMTIRTTRLLSPVFTYAIVFAVADHRGQDPASSVLSFEGRCYLSIQIQIQILMVFVVS